MAEIKSNTLPWMVLSFLAALSLRILPIAYPWSVLNPDWVALVLIYWVLTSQGGVGVGLGWFVGIISDALTGHLLGQEALAYSVLAYLVLRWDKQIRFHSLPQQSLSILGLLLLEQILVFWTERVAPLGEDLALYWLSSFFGAFLWPIAIMLTNGTNSSR